MTKVENDEYGLAKEVRVKTGANLSDISHIYRQKDPDNASDESRDN